MLSVYKFPIALALAEQYRTKGLSLDRPVAMLPQDLHTNTYSPMTEKNHSIKSIINRHSANLYQRAYRLHATAERQ